MTSPSRAPEAPHLPRSERSYRRAVASASCPGGCLDARVSLDPERRVVPLRAHALCVGSHRSIELLAKNVGVPSMTTGLGKEVREHVEQGHLGVVPPGHAA